MDGNFKAEHMHEKQPGDQVWLMDGLGYMVTRPDYQEYLKATHHEKEVNVVHISTMWRVPLLNDLKQRSTCNNHRAVNQANASRGKLESTGIGGTACARHGCFVPHSVVDFQKGERYVISPEVNAYRPNQMQTGEHGLLFRQCPQV